MNPASVSVDDDIVLLFASIFDVERTLNGLIVFNFSIGNGMGIRSWGTYNERTHSCILDRSDSRNYSSSIDV